MNRRHRSNPAAAPLLLALLLLVLWTAPACTNPEPEEPPVQESTADPLAVDETLPETAPPSAEEALEEADQRFAAAFAGPIEETHGSRDWYRQEAISADIELQFGGNRVLEGTMIFTPEMSQARMDLVGSGEGPAPTVVWDGSTAWVSPADAEFPQARFHVLTWPYFLAAPMKLRDPGSRLEDLGEREMKGRTYDVARLTFGEGVGDTPEDWYVLYRDRETDRLGAMAYIVTYGTAPEEAEAEPHAITYEDFVTVDGVAVPQTWQFWLWNEEEGIHGDPIGRVDLSDVRFVDPPVDTFAVPENAREEDLPTVPKREG